MTALSWARLGLLWSSFWLVFSVYNAATASAPAYAWMQSGCAVVHLALAVLFLRGLLTELRLRELRRRRRVLSLRGLACYLVFEDRCADDNPRRHLASSAMLSATRALDELVSVRVAMGLPA